MKPFALLAALVAALALLLVYPLLGPGSEDPPGTVRPEAVAPASAAEPAPPELPASVDGPGAGSAALEAPSARTSLLDPGGASEGDGTVWTVRGRVALGAVTPHPLRVLASQPAGEFERAREVGPDGRFELDVPRRVGLVELDLDGAFHFLAEPLRVRRPGAGEPAREVTLEATLGGRLLVALAPPEGFGIDALDDAEVTLSTTRQRRTITREAVALGDGRFELRGVAEDRLWELHARCAPFVTLRRRSERVLAGETRELALRFEAGVRLAGRVLGPGGVPAAGASVRVDRFGRSDTRGDRWLPDGSAETDGEGRFNVSDVRAGELRVRVEAEGLADLEEPLGALADGEERSDLTLELRAGGVVSGRVLWPSGGGAAGADVRVLREDQPWITEARARTDAAGGFRVGGLGDGPFLVTARAERDAEGGLLGQRLTGVAPGAEALELVLGPGDRIAGVVLDDLGAPLERFHVVAQPVESSSAAPGRRRLRERVRAKDGRFELGGLAAGPWDVRVEAREHADGAWVRVELPDGGGELRFTLGRLAEVAGVVRDPGGAPVAGARVRASFPGGGEALATTDADGAFTLDDLVPGATELVAEQSGLRASAPLVLGLAPGESREGAALELRVGARLEGTIDPSVEDFAGRRVLVRPADGYSGPTTLPGSDGRFAFEGLDPGEWVVLFDWQPSGGGGEDWIEGYERRAETRVRLAEGETSHVVLGAPVEGAVTVSGLVTDGGEPCPRYILYVFGEEETVESDMPLQISRADDEGRYALEVPGPGRYRFTVGESVNSQVRFFVDVGEGPDVAHDFELPGRAIAGRVVLEDGSPSPRHTLMLVHADANEDARAMGSQALTTTDLDGAFRFAGVPVGEYRLRTGGWGMDPNGLGVRVVTGLVVEAGEDLEGLVVEVRAGAVVEGRVLGSDGSPAQGVRVEPYDAFGQALYRWKEARTDHTGAFRLDDLDAGRLRLEAELEDGRVVAAEVETRAGEVSAVLLRP